MDTKRLTYFCAIVEHGQISRAARALNMTQPPLSQRLIELEAELGATLISREGHTWQVTEAGQLLYERARQVMNQVNEIPAEIKNVVDGFSGTLRIGSSSTCVSAFLKVLPGLRKAHPRLKFRVLVSDSSELEAHVLSRDLDFALLLLPVRGEDYVVHPLREDDFSVVVPAGVAREGLPPVIGVEDLAGLPLVCSRRWSGGGTYDHFIRAFQKKGLVPDIVMDTPDTRTGLGALLEGLPAAAIFPTREIPAGLSALFGIHTLDLKDMAIHPAIVHLKDRFISKAVQVVMDTLRQA